MKSTKMLLMLSLVTLAVSFTTNSQHSCRRATSVLKADGGSPMPPIPNGVISIPASRAATALVADGGSPMPPIPNGAISIPASRAATALVADGGSPMPPIPQGSLAVPTSVPHA
jgi:hypothetical protein